MFWLDKRHGGQRGRRSVTARRSMRFAERSMLSCYEETSSSISCCDVPTWRALPVRPDAAGLLQRVSEPLSNRTVRCASTRLGAGCVIIRMPLSASAHARLSQQRSEQLAACSARLDLCGADGHGATQTASLADSLQKPSISVRFRVILHKFFNDFA